MFLEQLYRRLLSEGKEPSQQKTSAFIETESSPTWSSLPHSGHKLACWLKRINFLAEGWGRTNRQTGLPLLCFHLDSPPFIVGEVHYSVLRAELCLLVKAGAHVHQLVLTLSAYLLALTQWGHGWMHLSYHYTCRAKPQALLNVFVPPCKTFRWVLFPEQVQCSSVGSAMRGKPVTLLGDTAAFWKKLSREFYEGSCAPDHVTRNTWT